MTARALPVWRSILFVPVLNERFLAGALTRGADAIQLDLEDSIPLDRKDTARQAVRPAAERLHAAGADVVVRINRSWRMALPDLEASVCNGVVAVTLPKCPHAEHVQAVAEVLDELEEEAGLVPGHTGIIALIETPEGLGNMRAIAAASPRVIGISVGSEDLAFSMGMEPVAEALYVPNVQAVAAAREAGCLPLGFVGSIAEFADEAAFRAMVAQARRLGFVGSACIHPRQVTILNEEFSPTAAEVASAQAMVDAYEQGLRGKLGAVALDGKMIDRPVMQRAQAVLERHRSIAGRQGSSGGAIR